jgi:asparagine synthase (glutamine-hydrolysing)
MVKALGHRGPDDHGLFVDRGVGLVNTRLSILDLSAAGHQPMRRGEHLTLVYNGEIFNHLTLRAELSTQWRGTSDTETLLSALERWDTRALSRLNGQFAFALLDRRRNLLLLGRDPLGVKPLYYVRQGDELIFGSEVAALIAGGYRPAADPIALRHAIDLEWVGGPVTPLAGVRRVLPGTALEFRLDRLSAVEHEYYHPADTVTPARLAELAGASAAENLDRVADALRTAVGRQLLSDVPVGTLLSGGVDSSLLTALAVERRPSLHAFNASIVDGTGVDEGPYAEEVAEYLGVHLHQVKVDATSWSTSLVDAVRHYEYPLTHEASVPLSLVSKLAKATGVKVLISGEGADELFGGYPWLHRPDWRRWFDRARPVRRFRHDVRALLERAHVLAERKAEPRVGPSRDASAWEAANLARCIAAYASHGRARRRLEGKLLDELYVYLAQILCRADKNIMQHSVEGRVPFLDLDLVSLAANLPLEHKTEPRRKEPLRALADRLLPSTVSARPKVAFRFDPGRYFEAANPLFLRDGHLRHLLETPVGEWTRRIDAARYHQTLLLWTAEIWCRLFLDGTSVTSVEQELWRDS